MGRYCCKSRKSNNRKNLAKVDLLRAKLSSLKSGGFPLCGDNAVLDVRLARPEETALYRQAADASQSTGDLMLVYLIELDGPES